MSHVTHVLTARSDRVVCAVTPTPTEINGILIPEGRRENYAAAREAVVLDVGPLVREILPGDTVFIAPLAEGVDVTIDGRRLRVIGQHAVLAVVAQRRSAVALRADIERLQIALAEAVASDDAHAAQTATEQHVTAGAYV